MATFQTTVYEKFKNKSFKICFASIARLFTLSCEIYELKNKVAENLNSIIRYRDHSECQDEKSSSTLALNMSVLKLFEWKTYKKACKIAV